MSKKILHVITGLGDGGAEAALFRLMVECSDLPDYTHMVISLSDGNKYVGVLREIGVEVFVLNLKSGVACLANLFKLFNIIKRLEPDVVQTWMYHANLIGGCFAYICGVKKIIWGIHNGDLDKKTDKLLTRLFNRCSCYLSYTIPSSIIYCGHSARSSHESYGYDVTKSKVIPNGIDAKKFVYKKAQYASEIQKKKANADTFVIGHLGRYHPVKNYPLMLDVIEAFQNHGEYKKFELHLYGSGLSCNNKELDLAIKDRGIEKNVKLFGPTSNIEAAYHTFDAFLLTSLSEAFPTVLNEAMLFGVPCISTNVGDVGAIIHNYGWIISSGDPVALVDAVSEAYLEKTKHSHLWERRRIKGRYHIQGNFSINKMLIEYRAVWFN